MVVQVLQGCLSKQKTSKNEEKAKFIDELFKATSLKDSEYFSRLKKDVVKQMDASQDSELHEHIDEREIIQRDDGKPTDSKAEAEAAVVAMSNDIVQSASKALRLFKNQRDEIEARAHAAKSYNDASKQHKAVLKLFQSLNKNMGSIDTEEVKGAEVSEEQAKLCFVWLGIVI